MCKNYENTISRSELIASSQIDASVTDTIGSAEPEGIMLHFEKTRDDRKGDLIILGANAVNTFAFAKNMEERIPAFRIRTNTDDYPLISAKDHSVRNFAHICF